MSDVHLPLVGSLDSGDAAAAPLLQDTLTWKAVHAFCFLLGGTTFCAGTAALYPDPSPQLATLSAALYTVGSLGFLAVDVLEFFTFTSPCLLRSNILLSACGSAFYVAGSLGYFPALLAASPALGVWGFILGSALIGLSQLCKLRRIAHSAGALEVPGDAATACGVEGGAAAGAWLFFAGTLLGLLNASAQLAVLGLWMGGSVAFTVGGVSLAWRHFGLGLS
jgi:hypothetical protein